MTVYDAIEPCFQCGTGIAKWVKVPSQEDPSGRLHECVGCGTTKEIWPQEQDQYWEFD